MKFYIYISIASLLIFIGKLNVKIGKFFCDIAAYLHKYVEILHNKSRKELENE